MAHEKTLYRNCVENGQRLRELEAQRDALLKALDLLTSNARLVADGRMGGATDCYAVPLDDIEHARAAIAKVTGK